MSAQSLAPSAMIEQDGNRLKLKIRHCRTMFANVHTPRPGTPGSAKARPKPPQYDCEFLLPKGADGVDAVVEKIRSSGRKFFEGVKWKSAVIQDADREIAEMQATGVDINDAMKMKAGHWVIKANSAVERPPVTRGLIYSGCYANAIISVSTYPAVDGGLPGIKGYLNGVDFSADGQRLGGNVVDLDAEFGPPPAQSKSQDDDFGAGAYTGSKNDPNSDLPF